MTPELKKSQLVFRRSLGVFLILLSILCILNQFIITRYLNYGVIFLFGYFYLFFYLVLAFIGVFLIINHRIKIFRSKLILTFFILFMVSLYLTLSAFLGLSEFSEFGTFLDLFKWNNEAIIPLYETSEFGGGLFGYALVSLMRMGMPLLAVQLIPFSLAIIFFVLMFYRLFINLGRHIKMRIKTYRDNKSIIKTAKDIEFTPTITTLNQFDFNQPVGVFQTVVDENEIPLTDAITSSSSPITFETVIKGETINDVTTPKTTLDEKVDLFSDEMTDVDVTAGLEEKEAIKPSKPLPNPDLIIPLDNDFDTPLSEKLVKMEFNDGPDLNVRKGHLTESEIYAYLLDNRPYEFPSMSLLKEYDETINTVENTEENTRRMAIINETLENLNINAKTTGFTIGPSVSNFDLRFEAGVQSQRIMNYIPDISRELNGESIRISLKVKGRTTGSIEVPNKKRSLIGLKTLLRDIPSDPEHLLSFPFGKNVFGEVIHESLDEIQHMLVGGASGSGKSIFLQSFILTFLMRVPPSDLRFVIIDPKQMEMNIFEDIRHLLSPIITTQEEANNALKLLIKEMETRYRLFKEFRVQKLSEYNEYAPLEGKPKLPTILLIFDEYVNFADLRSPLGKEINNSTMTLSSKARACGIYLCFATQRPSAEIFSSSVKANFLTRVAMKTFDSTNS
ncbi:MAG: hypothetical protein LBR37_01830, partial [Erysipelotrichaceae bacterium]|nr:hypothetical protein [Erysipelotrichaceae bacterium]